GVGEPVVNQRPAHIGQVTGGGDGFADVAPVEPRPRIPRVDGGFVPPELRLNDRTGPHLVLRLSRRGAVDDEVVPPRPHHAEHGTARSTPPHGDGGVAVGVQLAAVLREPDVVQVEQLLPVPVPHARRVRATPQKPLHGQSSLVTSRTVACASGSTNSVSASRQIVYGMPHDNVMCSTGPPPVPYTLR